MKPRTVLRMSNIALLWQELCLLILQAQFFINTAENQFLDFPGQDSWGYCVFGEVVAGKDVVDKIQTVETINLGGHSDVPGESVIITKATISD